ncbi:MAG: PadR family transcriptional regulator [Spirochaetales bacterium]|nr:PadR family transcriptional regulator [Spirochaetales bacterium]
MSTRLVLLGLLKEKPLHGYEIKHIIESHMGDWTNIAFGSIYFALRKLTEENLVEEVSSEQRGNRPSRRVYCITEEGRNEFMVLLEELWAVPVRDYFPLDVGLFFMNQLPREKRISLIAGRIEGLRQTLKHLEEHRESTLANPLVPPVSDAIFSHTLYHLRAELAWLEGVEKSILEGQY